MAEAESPTNADAVVATTTATAAATMLEKENEILQKKIQILTASETAILEELKERMVDLVAARSQVASYKLKWSKDQVD